MMDIQNLLILNKKSSIIQLISFQPHLYNDNNLNLLIDKKSSILKLNKLVYLII